MKSCFAFPGSGIWNNPHFQFMLRSYFIGLTLMQQIISCGLRFILHATQASKTSSSFLFKLERRSMPSPSTTPLLCLEPSRAVDWIPSSTSLISALNSSWKIEKVCVCTWSVFRVRRGEFMLDSRLILL